MRRCPLFCGMILMMITTMSLPAQNCVPWNGYSTDLYQISHQGSGGRNCLLQNITVGGKKLLLYNKMYCIIQENEKKLTLAERKNGVAQFTGNTLVAQGVMTAPDKTDYLEISRMVVFSPEAVDVAVTVKALKDFHIPSSWGRFTEVFALDNSLVMNEKLEGVNRRGEVLNAVMEKKYDKNVWRPWYNLKYLKLTVPGYALTLLPESGSSLQVNHYGGPRSQLRIAPDFSKAQYQLRKGDTRTWKYRIKFYKN